MLVQASLTRGLFCIFLCVCMTGEKDRRKERRRYVDFRHFWAESKAKNTQSEALTAQRESTRFLSRLGAHLDATYRSQFNKPLRTEIFLYIINSLIDLYYFLTILDSNSLYLVACDIKSSEIH